MNTRARSRDIDVRALLRLGGEARRHGGYGRCETARVAPRRAAHIRRPTTRILQRSPVAELKEQQLTQPPPRPYQRGERHEASRPLETND